MNPIEKFKMQVGGEITPGAAGTSTQSIDAIKNLLKQKHEIANPEQKPSASSRESILNIQMKFSEENLMAFILVPVPTPESPAPTDREVLEYLQNYGIVFGLDKNLISMITSFNAYGVFREIAIGRPPVNGEDAKVEFMFDPEHKLTPRELDNGNVDFKELGFFQNVRKGDVLAKITPHTMGISGRNVFGEAVKPIPGKPAQAIDGGNTRLNPQGTVLIAAEDGYVTFADGVVTVRDTYEHYGDVRVSSGNLDFVGNLIIHGDVRDGFFVKTGKDLTVNGNVEGAQIEVAGDCIVKGGVNGKNVGNINCGGSFTARFIENMTIVCGKTITTSSIMNSIVEASESINCTNRPGVIVGGSVSAGSSINAYVIGKPNITNLTELSIGVPPLLMRKRKELKEQVESIRSKLSEINKAVAYLNGLKKQGTLPESKKGMEEEMTIVQCKEKLRVIKMEKDLQTLETDILASKFGQLCVYSSLNRPAQITINSIVMTVDETLGKARFYNKDGVLLSDQVLPPI